MDVVVTGIGVVSALGDLEQTWKGLIERRSSIRFYQPFASLEKRPIAFIDHQPAEILSLTRRIALAAIDDAKLEFPLTDCGVVVGSSRSNQAQWETLAAGQGDVSQWINTLPNAVSIAVARLLQSEGIVLAPMAACATGLWAIAQATDLIQSRQCQRVIAGAIEAPITPLTLAGFERLGALARQNARPFDLRRDGLVLGEGGAVFILESIDLAKQRGAKIYGRVRGFGLTADGYHVSAPEPGSKGAIAAVQHCLKRSQLKAKDVDYIHAHGTATQLNDRNEAYLINQIFSKHVPVSSTKGATGHTLGASGALGTAVCLMALQNQVVPPNVGLDQPEFDIGLVREARSTNLENMLCFSFGFGGQNAVIALSR